MVHVLIDPFAFERFRSLLDQPSDNFEMGFMKFLTQMIFRDLKNIFVILCWPHLCLRCLTFGPYMPLTWKYKKSFNENPYLGECFDSAVVQPPSYMMVDIMEQFHHVELGKVPRVMKHFSWAEADSRGLPENAYTNQPVVFSDHLCYPFLWQKVIGI